MQKYIVLIYHTCCKVFFTFQVLDETMNMAHFDSFKRADVYSFGLVLWEIAWRTKVQGMITSRNTILF